MYLKRVSVSFEAGAYPLNRAQIGSLGAMELDAPVTLLAGDNGTGKSTFLEALARKMNLPAIGTSDAGRDDTLKGVQPLCDKMRLTFARKPGRGFFLRSEDFFGFIKRVASMQAEMRSELARVEEEYAGRSEFAKGQARMAFAGSLGELTSRYGVDPDAMSHGESYLSLFGKRIVPGGLYLLDEPETPLSPMRLLSLIALIMQREADSQFIIATHSPVLLAYPGAALFSFDRIPAARAAWDELPQVALTRDFLRAPERYLKHLRSDE